MLAARSIRGMGETVRILIIGAAGMIGRKLAERLAREGSLGGAEITSMVLADLSPPPKPPVARCGIQFAQGDLAEPGVAAELVRGRPDVIVDLAAVVSGEAESDFEKGYRANLDGTRALLEAVRLTGDGYRPRLVFSSSVAVFGPPLPDVIGDEQATTPATSYGTQKAVAELLLADYSRRGFVDAVAIRLPTICVRPGAANLAASGFFSNIIREPLNGRPAVLPVSPEVRHWFASPRSAVGFLLHAATLDTSDLGVRRSLTMPGLSATVGDEIEALRRVAGDAAVALIHPEPDEGIARMVAGWPGGFDARRASALGFVAETHFDEIVRAYVEDELGGAASA
jgi:D-erythronate 2-dehydrogenase